MTRAPGSREQEHDTPKRRTRHRMLEEPGVKGRGPLCRRRHPLAEGFRPSTAWIYLSPLFEVDDIDGDGEA